MLFKFVGKKSHNNRINQKKHYEKDLLIFSSSVGSFIN